MRPTEVLSSASPSNNQSQPNFNKGRYSSSGRKAHSMVVIWQITSCKLFVFNKFRSFTWSRIHITLFDGIHERHLEYSHGCWWWRFWPFCSEQQGDGKSRDWSTQEELRSLQPQRLTTGISFRELFDNRRHALQVRSTILVERWCINMLNLKRKAEGGTCKI